LFALEVGAEAESGTLEMTQFLVGKRLKSASVPTVVAQLRSKQWVWVDGEKVSYHLPVGKSDATGQKG
jgi:hypothetical protein